MAEIVTVTGRPLLLDEILAARFDAATARRLVTAALELNPGLAALGTAIPVGTRVTLPDRPAIAAETVAVVSLYG